MKSKTWQIHIFCARCRIQPTENKSKPLCVAGLNPCGATEPEKLSQTFVLEVSDHD
jgi:hypothetical protein